MRDRIRFLPDLYVLEEPNLSNLFISGEDCPYALCRFVTQSEFHAAKIGLTVFDLIPLLTGWIIG